MISNGWGDYFSKVLLVSIWNNSVLENVMKSRGSEDESPKLDLDFRTQQKATRPQRQQQERMLDAMVA